MPFLQQDRGPTQMMEDRLGDGYFLLRVKCQRKKCSTNWGLDQERLAVLSSCFSPSCLFTSELSSLNRASSQFLFQLPDSWSGYLFSSVPPKQMFFFLPPEFHVSRIALFFPAVLLALLPVLLLSQRTSSVFSCHHLPCLLHVSRSSSEPRSSPSFFLVSQCL